MQAARRGPGSPRAANGEPNVHTEQGLVHLATRRLALVNVIKDVQAPRAAQRHGPLTRQSKRREEAAGQVSAEPPAGHAGTLSTGEAPPQAPPGADCPWGCRAGEGASPLPSDCRCAPTMAQPDGLSMTCGTRAVADLPQALGEAIKAKDYVSLCGTLGDMLPCHSFPGTVRVQTPSFRQTPCGPWPEACPHGCQGSLPTWPQRRAALGEQGGQPRPTAAGLRSPSQDPVPPQSLGWACSLGHPGDRAEVPRRGTTTLPHVLQ